MNSLFRSRCCRCCVCLILVLVLLISWSPIRARAMAGGGVIGGASAAGLALSPGMAAILLLAAFGVYYAVDNADAIGRSLEVALEAEATNTELSLAAQAEYAAALTSWWESAKAGVIELISAPAWIVDTVKAWCFDFYNNSPLLVPPSNVSGYPVPALGATYPQGSKIAVGPKSSDYVYSSIPCQIITYYQITHGGKRFVSSYVLYTTNSSGAYSAGFKSSVSVNDITYYFRAGSSCNSTVYDTAVEDFGSLYIPFCFFEAPANLTAYEDVFLLYLGGSVTAHDAVQHVYPDVITGGIASELDKGIGMDVIGLPDIVIPGPDVLPVNPSEGQTTAQAVTDYLMAALIAGEITWEQYWQLIGVYNPAIGSSVPTVGTVDPVTGTITNTEISTGTVVTPSAIVDYQIDLKKFFPFCIPFDLYDFFMCLNADPVAPVIEWVIPLSGGDTYPLVIDLSAFDSVAQLLRRLQLLLFCVGLAFKTRDLIKG